MIARAAESGFKVGASEGISIAAVAEDEEAADGKEEEIGAWLEEDGGVDAEEEEELEEDESPGVVLCPFRRRLACPPCESFCASSTCSASTPVLS